MPANGYLDAIWREVEDGIVEWRAAIGVLSSGVHLCGGEEDVDVGILVTHYCPVEGGETLIVLKGWTHEQIQCTLVANKRLQYKQANVTAVLTIIYNEGLLKDPLFTHCLVLDASRNVFAKKLDALCVSSLHAPVVGSAVLRVRFQHVRFVTKPEMQHMSTSLTNPTL